ncbi:MAG: ParB/RepB/Spo0J family partition protein [Actinomycetota bacterium]|nr:ParB/RepB/Spo0J family partition protein [Actinomycetota bacterium]
MIEVLSIDKIVPAPDNPRRSVGDVTELAASIAAVGIIEPLVVTPLGDGTYQLVAGARRHAAARIAGLGEVTAVVRQDLDDAARQELMLIENLQREDLAPLEEAEAFDRLMGMGYTQRRLAKRLSISQSHVSKRLNLLRLPSDARTFLDSGGITLAEAQELTKLADDPAATARVLGRGAYMSVQRAVEGELHAAQRAQARAAAVSEAKEAGYRVIATPANLHSTKVRRVGSGYGDLDVAGHDSLSCHALTFPHDSAELLVAVCTKPATHAATTSPAEAKRKAKEARLQDERKALREAGEARQEVARRILGTRLPKGDVLTHLAAVVVGAHQVGAAPAACRLLGLEPLTTETFDTAGRSYGTPYKDWRGALQAFAATGPDQLTKAALALALAEVEADLAWEHRDTWDEPRLVEHLDLLIRHGHELSEAEQSRLRAPKG